MSNKLTDQEYIEEVKARYNAIQEYLGKEYRFKTKEYYKIFTFFDDLAVVLMGGVTQEGIKKLKESPFETVFDMKFYETKDGIKLCGILITEELELTAQKWYKEILNYDLDYKDFGGKLTQ